MNKQSTRYYSNRQEKSVARILKGKKQVNSGATKFKKGDIETSVFLIEAKTKMKPSNSFTIKKEWLDKNKEEAYEMGKFYNALVFDFGDNEHFYIVDENLFQYLNKKLWEEENQ